MRPKELQEFLKNVAIPNRWPVLVTSSPGCGKTDIITEATKACGFNLIVSHPVVSDPTDFKGMPFINTDGEAEFIPFNDLKQLVQANKPTVFFLDDLGQAPSSVQAAAMQLLLARQINGHKISDEVTFLAATNRRQDKAGVSGILEPVKSRFRTIIDLKPDEDDWCEWALSHNMPLELIAFIRWTANKKDPILYSFNPSLDIQNNSPCPRTFAFVGDMMKAKMNQSYFVEVVKGAIGEAATTTLMGFIRICSELPNPLDLIADPEKCKLPASNRPDILYALTSAIAGKANKKNFGNIIRLSERLPKEFGLMLIQDCIIMDELLADIEAFQKWSEKNVDLIP